jgi:hypothetical protein
VPASLKLQETYGDDLQVLFVESQGASAQDAASFAIAQKWFGGRAMWTTDSPFWTGSNGLPSCALIGNDGKVLLKGNPLVQHKEIERQIGEQIKLRKSPPASVVTGSSKGLRSAWNEFGKGRYAQAFSAARAAELDASGDAAALAAVKQSLDTFNLRLSAQFQRVQWLVENGYFEEAGDVLEGLKKGVKGDADLEKRADEIAQRLDSRELAPEREAARTFGRLASKFYESGGDPLVARELDLFAQRNAATKSARRAAELAKLARGGGKPGR